jgi:hypothetical protein
MAWILTHIWAFLIYWLIVFVCCYVVTEFAQNYLYDEVTPAAFWKILLGSIILAAVLTWTRSSFDTMFITQLPWTVLQGIVWFAVFTLIFRFHPPHAAAIGIVVMVLVSGLATLGVDSLTKTNRPTLPDKLRTAKPMRQPATPPIAVPSKAPGR